MPYIRPGHFAFTALTKQAKPLEAARPRGRRAALCRAAASGGTIQGTDRRGRNDAPFSMQDRSARRSTIEALRADIDYVQHMPRRCIATVGDPYSTAGAANTGRASRRQMITAVRFTLRGIGVRVIFRATHVKVNPDFRAASSDAHRLRPSTGRRERHSASCESCTQQTTAPARVARGTCRAGRVCH